MSKSLQYAGASARRSHQRPESAASTGDDASDDADASSPPSAIGFAPPLNPSSEVRSEHPHANVTPKAAPRGRGIRRAYRSLARPAKVATRARARPSTP